MTSQTTDSDASRGADMETPRVIGPIAGFAIVAGSMLGVGIFLMPSQVAMSVDSVGAFIALWIAGGLFALAGSVACGELGAMLPKAGGDYVFQREAFGNSIAFASGWVLFAAIFSGSIASMSVAVCEYQLSGLFGVDLAAPAAEGVGISYAQLIAIGIILALTALNDAGTRLSARTQTVLTILPIATLVVLALYAIIAAPPLETPADAGPKPGATTLTLAGLAAGYLAVNFAFSGWLNIIYVAGEVDRPGRNIPLSMFSGTTVVTVLYVLLCAAFLSVLGLAGVASLGYDDAGTAVANALGSPFIATLVLIVIAVAIVTSLNATVLASARVAYAMGKGGAFWSGASRLSRRRTPSRALWIQAALASVIVLAGTFHEIVAMTSLAMFITGTITVSALFWLRRKRPEMPRPYRASFYPWFPALYVLSSLLVIGLTAANAFDTMFIEVAGPEGAATEAFNVKALFPLFGVGVLLAAFAGHYFLVARHARRGVGVVVGVIIGVLALHHITRASPTTPPATEAIETIDDDDRHPR